MYIIWYQRTDSSHSSISNYNWITTLPCLACVGDWYRLLSTQIIEYDAWYESQRRVAILAMDTRMVDCPVWILPKWHPYSVGWFVLSSFAIRDGSSLGQLNTRPITFTPVITFVRPPQWVLCCLNSSSRCFCTWLIMVTNQSLKQSAHPVWKVCTSGCDQDSDPSSYAPGRPLCPAYYRCLLIPSKFVEK